MTRRWVGVALWACVVSGCALQPPPAILSADDRVAVAQITEYMNNLHSFQARFTQMGPTGMSQGEVWLQRPGQLAVAYEAPFRKVMIAHNGRLLVADLQTGAKTTLPVSRTPLDILLAPTIELNNSVTITGIQRLPGALQLNLVKTAAPSQGTLTLRFAENPLALAGVRLLDRNGETTSFDLSDFQANVPVDAEHFVYHAPKVPEG